MKAIHIRTTFQKLYHSDKDGAFEFLKGIMETLRSDNTTGISGVTRSNCGFIVRVWNKETKKRNYIGHFKTLENCIVAIKESQNED